MARPNSDDADEVPAQIIDYSCVTPLEEAAADLEAWLRTCLVDDLAIAGGGALPSDANTRTSATPFAPRVHEFYFPLRDDVNAALSASTTNFDRSMLRETNCVAELFGRLSAASSSEAAADSDRIVHPIALHFGLTAFLVVRYDGPSSHRPGEGAMLLSIASTALQQAGIPLPAFAPRSTDAEGVFAGSLPAFVATMEGGEMSATTYCNVMGDYHRTSAVELAATAAKQQQGKSAPLWPVCRHRGLTAPLKIEFAIEAAPFNKLFSAHHGAAPASTLEGLVEIFRSNAGRATKFVSEGLQNKGTATVTATVVNCFNVAALSGPDWEYFVERELNAESESLSSASADMRRSVSSSPKASAGSRGAFAPILDPTTPRALFMSAPPASCGSSVPIGTSVAPFECVAVDVEWRGVDVDSAAFVDNAARSAFAELVDTNIEEAGAASADTTRRFGGGTAASGGASSAAHRSIAPSAVGIRVVWRARSEVTSLAADETRKVAGIVAAAFGADDDSSSNAEDGTPTNADGGPSAADADDVYGEQELPTHARVAAHFDQIMRCATAEPLVARFAQECMHLQSVEEMYALWLRVTDHLQALLIGGAAPAQGTADMTQDVAAVKTDAGAAPQTLPDAERYAYLHRLLTGHGAGADNHQNEAHRLSARVKPLAGQNELLHEKVEALATCLLDELDVMMGGGAGTSRGHLQNPRLDGWDDDGDDEPMFSSSASNSSMKSCRSGEAGDNELKDDVVSEKERCPSSESASGHPPMLILAPAAESKFPRPQRRAPVTRDAAAQQQRDLLRLEQMGAKGQQQRAAEQAAAMVADMSRFKHANRPHEVLLADFIRWYSPKDFVARGQEVIDQYLTERKPHDSIGVALLSKRMQVEGSSNVWITSWERAAATELPDVAYDPIVEARAILKYLAGVSQEEVGSCAAVATAAMVVRRLGSARVWRLHYPTTTLPGGDGTAHDHTRKHSHCDDSSIRVLPRLAAKADRLYRAAVKAIPTDEQLQATGCGSAAAWVAQFAAVLEHIEALDVLAAAASCLVRLLLAARSDATVDGDACLLVADGDHDSVRDRWRFADELLARAWEQGPWAGEGAPLSARHREEHIRRLRGLPAHVMSRLQCHPDSVLAPSPQLWSSWLAWRLLRPRGFLDPKLRAKSEDGLHSPSALTGDEALAGAPHIRAVPFTVHGRRLHVDVGAVPDAVTLATKRVELMGYAIRPLTAQQQMSAATVSGSPSQRSAGAVTVAPTLQAMTATFDYVSKTAHFALCTSQCLPA